MSRKRFTLSERDLNEINNSNAIADDGIPCTQRHILKLLNELYDENEQLKQQNEFLKKRCNEYWEEAGLNSDYYDWMSTSYSMNETGEVEDILHMVQESW